MKLERSRLGSFDPALAVVHWYEEVEEEEACLIERRLLLDAIDRRIERRVPFVSEARLGEGAD